MHVTTSAYISKICQILKNLQAADSLPTPPPLFLTKNGKKKNFSSSWLPVTCYGQFALPIEEELNVFKSMKSLRFNRETLFSLGRPLTGHR